ncbi:MAG: hypothetical protein FJ278_18620, partial [Planctomycetes bacterium]|nr:hypothetical protein [Planctomycetota bacterium]
MLNACDLLRFVCLLLGTMALASVVGFAQGQSYWDAPDRGTKVAALIPGRRIPKLTPETLFVEWTKQQMVRWDKANAPLPPEEAYQKYAATPPTDAELTRDFPVHISPFGRVRSGKPDRDKAALVMITFCPFCHSQSMSLQFDAKNTCAVTSCC